MFKFLKDRSPGVIHRIRFLMPVVARDAEGISAPRSIGDEIEVLASEAGLLIGEGMAKDLGTVTSTGITPPRKLATGKIAEFVRRPAPERYKELEKCFGAAWEHYEDRRKLRFDVDNAQRAVSGNSLAVGDSEVRDYIKIRETHREALEKLHKHMDAGEPRSVFECSRCAISEIRSANGVRDSLAATAFAIFEHRIAALQLSREKVQTLFAGSADDTKYFTQRLSEYDLRTAGGFEYIDAPLESLACIIFNARAFKAECYAKLDQAKAEFDAVRGLTKPSKKAA